MNTSTQKIRALAFASAPVFVVAGMLAGAVQAGTNAGSYLQHGGRSSMSSRCPCNSGLPGALESGALVEASVQTAPSSECPCNVGLPGVPSQLSRAAQKPAAAPVSENSPIENRLTPASPVVVPTTVFVSTSSPCLIRAVYRLGTRRSSARLCSNARWSYWVSTPP